MNQLNKQSISQGNCFRRAVTRIGVRDVYTFVCLFVCLFVCFLYNPTLAQIRGGGGARRDKLTDRQEGRRTACRCYDDDVDGATGKG